MHFDISVMGRLVERLPVDRDRINGRISFGAQFSDGLSVDLDTAGRDQRLGCATTGYTRGRHNFLKPFFSH